MKNTFKKFISSKPVIYKKTTVQPMTMAPGKKSPTVAITPMRPVKAAAKRITPKSNMRSYGQVGYKPSTGKGVGY